MIDKMNTLMKEGKFKELYILARYYYREGQPFMDDKDYDKIHKFFVSKGILPEYTSRLYEEDPVPLDLLYNLELSPIAKEVVEETDLEDNPYYQELMSDASFSINPLTEYEEAWEYFDSHRDQQLISMIKIDGIYTRHKIVDGELKLSLTRGRGEGKPWNVTERAKIIMRNHAKNTTGSVRINGEAYVEESVLLEMSMRYDGHRPESERRFKTPKSAAISMLRVRQQLEDYKNLKFRMFSAEGLGGTTISENIDIARECGFDTVPYLIIEKGTVPETFEAFVDWLRGILDEMVVLQGDIPADGVVIDVNELAYTGDVNGVYMSRNIALKLEHWSHDYYIGVVDDIIEEPKGVTFSYVVKIEPLITNDRTKASRINAFNPSIIFKEGILPGQRIYFERNSGAVNILLHGKKIPINKEGTTTETAINSFERG